MNNVSKIIFSLILTLISTSLVAETATELETNHLLQYIGNSGCTFVRNGTDYTSEEAEAHILRKYNYVKNKVSTTEQVIEYAATESSFSGKTYTIKCPGQEPLPSAEWLTVELKKYRAEPKN